MSRAVLFDVDGVLVHGYHARPDLRVRWDENLLEDLGIDPDGFARDFIYAVFVNEVLTGRKSLVNALEETLPRLGFERSPMVLVDYWLTKDSNINVGLLESVRSLAQNRDLRLFIATNQDHMRALWLWQSLGFSAHFEDIFYAARLGVTKPDRRFFEKIAASIGPQDETPLLFDDSPQVIEAARAFGWEAVLYEKLEDVTGHAWIAQRL